MSSGRPSASRGLRFRRASPTRDALRVAAPAAPGGDEQSPPRTPRSAAAARTFTAPSLDALVRRAYYSHVSSQILVSNLPPWMFIAFTLRDGYQKLWALSHFETAVTVSCFSLLALPISLAAAFKLRNVLPPRLLTEAREASAFRAVVAAEWVSYVGCTVPLCAEFVVARGALNCGAGAGRGACALTFTRTFNAARAFKLVVTQIPASLAFAPEAAKQALAAACALAGFAADGALTPAAAASVAAHAICSLCLVMALVTLHTDPQFAERYVPAGLDACPGALRGARARLIAACAALCRRVRAPPLDYRALSGLAICANMLAAQMAGAGDVVSFARVGRHSLLVYGLLSLGSLSATWLAGGGTATLDGMAARLGLDRERSLIERLAAALAAESAAGSERAVLRAALAQMRLLFPGAEAVAMGAFAPDDDGTSQSSAVGGDTMVCAGFGEGDACHSNAARLLCGAATSVECVTSQARTLIADSRDFPDGLDTFSDWAAAREAGAAVAITAPLWAGPAKVGFITLWCSMSEERGGARQLSSYEAVLLEACHVIGECLFARRERDALATSRALARDIFPDHVLRALELRTRRVCAPPPLVVPRRRSPPRSSHSAPALNVGDIAAAVASMRVSAGGAPSPLRRPAPVEMDDAGGPFDASASRRTSTDEARGSTYQCTSPRGGAAAAAALARAAYPSAADEEGELYAEDHECITICFIDVVGFTALAEAQPAAATMRQLHALFSRFDELCGLLGCYKVETVGDAYMICAGMLPRMEHHASAALLFALHAHGAAAAAGLRVRAGVSSGPVASGLVGRLRARFCLFGDTVNVASRMESSGVAGAVQLTRAAWQLTGLPDRLAQPRRLAVKGKAEELDVVLVDSAAEHTAESVRRLQDTLAAAEEAALANGASRRASTDAERALFA